MRKGQEWPLVVIRFQRSLTVAIGPKQEGSLLSDPVSNITLSSLDVGIELIFADAEELCVVHFRPLKVEIKTI